MTKPRTLCVIYGINEGPGIGRDFELACQANGFTLIRNPENADVIFAHSGGCFLLPTEPNPRQLIILAGLPYWPGRPWLAATWKKVRLEFQDYRRREQPAQWWAKWPQHVRYALNLRPALRMLRNRPMTGGWNNSGSQMILRNRDDTYSMPDLTSLDFRGPRVFISFSGGHDDCWDNPQTYLNLIQSKYARR